MKQYFYIDSNNQQVGPINEDALMELVRCGDLSRQTPIWTEGLANWMPFGIVFQDGSEEPTSSSLGAESPTAVPETPAEVLPQEQPKLWSKYRKLFIIGGAMTLITAFSIAGYSVCFTSGDSASSNHKTAPAKKKEPKHAKISKEKAVTKLRELGVISSKLDIQASEGSKAMSKACAQGNLNIAELLLAGGINVEQIHKSNCLGVAAENGQAEIVKLLLALPGIDVNHSHQLTPLGLAAANGHVEVARLLLAAPGIDVNKKYIVKVTDDGSPVYATPLCSAAMWGHTEVVKLLLANPSIKVNDGDLIPLMCAVVAGHPEVVKLLLAAPGIDVNKKVGKRGFSVLWVAAERGRTEIVKLLLAAPGIDVNTKHESNFGPHITPLGVAVSNGHAEIVKLLLAVPGIDVNKGDQTPLWDAALHKNNLEILKLLLAAPGIDVNYEGDNKLLGPPLITAAQLGCTEAVRLLLAAPGIDVNKRHSVLDRTALQDATEEGHTEVVELLRAAGAQ